MSEGCLLWCLMYADDMAVFAESPEDLQMIVGVIHETFARYGLQMSFEKT